MYILMITRFTGGEYTFLLEPSRLIFTRACYETFIFFSFSFTTLNYLLIEEIHFIQVLYKCLSEEVAIRLYGKCNFNCRTIYKQEDNKRQGKIYSVCFTKRTCATYYADSPRDKINIRNRFERRRNINKNLIFDGVLEFHTFKVTKIENVGRKRRLD